MSHETNHAVKSAPLVVDLECY